MLDVAGGGDVDGGAVVVVAATVLDVVGAGDVDGGAVVVVAATVLDVVGAGDVVPGDVDGGAVVAEMTCGTRTINAPVGNK